MQLAECAGDVSRMKIALSLGFGCQRVVPVKLHISDSGIFMYISIPEILARFVIFSSHMLLVRTSRWSKFLQVEWNGLFRYFAPRAENTRCVLSRSVVCYRSQGAAFLAR